MAKKILFMCVANSARSQMAEGLARDILGADFEVVSAGSKPTKVNPIGIQAMQEVGIDISKHSSKTTEQIPNTFMHDLDFVVTLCAEEVCPVLPGTKAQKLHWPFMDPANASLSESEQLLNFRKVRDQISKRLQEWKQDLG
ncbi:arsenate reductase ArsC [Bdellovibrio sp. HCB337]|uniref:arsenate reductase ArsC n=1 Tax=Bdellovibrio sp. HCB337 TaxID=3394358 RepID=UPI0039A57247